MLLAMNGPSHRCLIRYGLPPGVGLLLILAILWTFDRGKTAIEEIPEIVSAGNGGREARTFGPVSETGLIARLRSLRDIRARDAPDFEILELWASGLPDAELTMLVEECGDDPAVGPTGWLRCALFAEWGRRDPLAALDWLSGEISEESDGPGLAQAWFSVIRGWAAIEPETALNYCESSLDPFSGSKMNGIAMHSDATERIRPAIFAELAARDPEYALRFVSANDALLDDPDIVTGVARGLRSFRDLSEFVEHWKSRISSSPVPPELPIRMALAMSKFDLDHAEGWLRETAAGHGSDPAPWIDRLHHLWAHEFPAKALRRIRSGIRLDLAESDAIAILINQPERGPELMAILQSADIRYKVIHVATADMATVSVNDYFPVPFSRNRLVDFDANRAAILRTIDAAGMHETMRTALLARVDSAFHPQLKPIR